MYRKFIQNQRPLHFRKQSDQESQQYRERIFALEAKLKAKNEVLSELMEEHVALKKSLGEI